MTSGFDIQKWQNCNEIARESGLTVSVVGDGFEIRDKRQAIMGVLYDLEHLYHYLCGFEVGYSKGRFKEGG